MRGRVVTPANPTAPKLVLETVPEEQRWHGVSGEPAYTTPRRVAGTP
jgi:hypothetical protein